MTKEQTARRKRLEHIRARIRNLPLLILIGVLLGGLDLPTLLREEGRVLVLGLLYIGNYLAFLIGAVGLRRWETWSRPVLVIAFLASLILTWPGLSWLPAGKGTGILLLGGFFLKLYLLGIVASGRTAELLAHDGDLDACLDPSKNESSGAA